MKQMICIGLALLALMGQARAAELPRDLQDAMPRAAEELLEDTEFSTGTGFVDGVSHILESLTEKLEEVLSQSLRGAAAVLAVVVLCGAVEGLWRGNAGEKGMMALPMAGALTITLLTVGSLDSLMGLGRQTIEELSVFAHVLLPALAAATAVAGGVTRAAVQQVTAVFLANLLIGIINSVLLPMVYLYTGVLTAGAALSEGRLTALAAAVKKIITWVLTTSLLGFTLYLTVSGIITGSVDAASVKVAKAAISGVVPVVGGIIADAAEAVLAGTGILRGTIGIFGTLAILAACAYPFLRLGVQYLLYKLTAFLAAVLGVPGLRGLIDGLGGAFGLVLGMTASCAVLLLVSVLSFVAAVAA